ncbi:type I restriction-modification system subunit M [Salinimonas sediminis]|uniref:site-specific DNA-methyltransferase (adenine-specific) n=1 Tax=Salinimonas sediminis TaxID=2303538 RepID=A0A346NHB4_9ALTE|nr:type I restriction-modification system subunit M [Salinimonas sediminis]AXR04921.1 type I restriction-modification system subunit M [Salinimonas sediminis]
MTEDHKRLLKQKLWNIADELRGKMNADGFRDYCLGFIFYKYLSERLVKACNDILKGEVEFPSYEHLDEGDEEHAEVIGELQDEITESLGYFLKPSELFSTLAERGAHISEKAKKSEDDDVVIDAFILGDLQEVLKNIERSTMGTESEDDFDQLFEELDLNASRLGRDPDARNALIAKIMFHLNSIDFKLSDSTNDVLGDAYEYLIGQFAAGAGKKAGEFYTPQSVSTILAKLVTRNKQRLQSVYDPTCGSGSLLLRVAKEVNYVNHFYGQEMNRTTFNLARMNMILHGVSYRNFDLKQDDTLESPQHIHKKFDAIVANPPFSAKWSAKKHFETDDRFAPYGKLAPSSKADFAFVQHMLHHLSDNGTLAVVLPHGVLFRGASEGHIRRYLIEECNWLDAVIGLPANIFYGTSIPTCILVFKKCRENPDNVLFIDASQHFEKAKNQNELRTEHIKKIIDTYHTRVNVDKYAQVAPLAEIAENDYNLNIPRYVDTFEEEEPVNLSTVVSELKTIEKEMAPIDEQIRQYCQELGIEAPV